MINVMKAYKMIKMVIVSFFAVLMFSSCEKSDLMSGSGPKGYWMSDREYSDCRRVYYFDGHGGGTVYYYLSTSSTNWNRDCDCHRYNTEFVGTFNGTKYYKQKNAGSDALIYTLVGTSVVVSSASGDKLDYINFSGGNLEGYSKVSKR
jgi:hypothetical protein